MTPEQQNILAETKKISEKLKKWRQQQKKIVLTQGTFDLVHIGHARYCAQAKKHGDILIVGVDSDRKVKQRKGDNRPIVPQAERMEMLAHLAAVSLVVLKEHDAPKWQLIKLVKPDVLIATKQTYTDKQIKDLQEYCGKVVVLEPQATTSTSAKIRLLQIGLTKKIVDRLGKKLTGAIESALNELKGEVS